jgi:hypothetical protein
LSGIEADKPNRKDISSILTTAVLVTGFLGMRYLTRSPVKAQPTQNLPQETLVNNDIAVIIEGAELKTELEGNFPESIKQWEELLISSREETDIVPELAAAIMWVESKGDPKIISDSGAVGLMQVMPREIIAGRPLAEELLNPEVNIPSGYEILAEELRQTNGNIEAALNGYFGSDEPFYLNERYYSSYADLVLQTWQQFSPETYTEYFKKEVSVENKTQTRFSNEIIFPKSFRLIDKMEGAKLWLGDNGVLTAVYNLSKLQEKTVVSSEFLSFDQLSKGASNAFGGTHYQGGVLEFPLKAERVYYGDALSLAYANQLKNQDKPELETQMLEFYSDYAVIKPFSSAEYLESQAPTIIIANNIYEKREFNQARPRTIVTVDQNNRLVVIIFPAADRDQVVEILKELNIDSRGVLNLAGGGQTGLVFNGKEYFLSSKDVTHLITLNSK